MKKLIISSLVIASSAVSAGPYHHYSYRPHHNSAWVWIAPTVIGGVIGYEIARQQQPTVIVQTQTLPQPVVVQQNCGPWTETRNADNTVTYTRTCSQ